MTEIATIDWFGRWGTFVFSENTAIFASVVVGYHEMSVMLFYFCSSPQEDTVNPFIFTFS